ncbi:MAG: nucleotidyltransferase domain-containing protein [Mariprofundaceae bacterium]|nr:nucleotidyltransferase domain-containing protein [Mariprofundaceae bacterium]
MKAKVICHLMVDQGKLNQMASDIHSKLLGVLGVYLFGSVAKGVNNAASDIDMAVLSDRILPSMDVWMLAQALAKDAGVDVDLIDLRSASVVMQIQIIAKGKRLLCIDRDTCERFEDFVYADFSRLNEERAGILTDIQSRGTVYG